MKENNRIAALILAAGFSSRMETFKPLLPVGGAPLIERTIARFLQVGFRDVRVVLAAAGGVEMITRPILYPTLSVEAGGIAFVRPDILEKD